MALHQKVSVASGISIEFHTASAPGEQFIGQNAQGPSDSANPPAPNVGGKQTNITIGSTKIVTPA